MGYVTGNHFRLGLAYQREQEKLRKQRSERVPSRLLFAIARDLRDGKSTKETKPT